MYARRLLRIARPNREGLEAIMITSYSREGVCEHNPDCGKKIWARRMCRSHYEKLKGLNTGRIKTKRIRPEVAEDFWSFVVRALKKEGHEIARKL